MEHWNQTLKEGFQSFVALGQQWEPGLNRAAGTDTVLRANGQLPEQSCRETALSKVRLSFHAPGIAQPCLLFTESAHLQKSTGQARYDKAGEGDRENGTIGPETDREQQPFKLLFPGWQLHSGLKATLLQGSDAIPESIMG